MKNIVDPNSVTLVNVDSLKYIKTLPANSIDLICTDPPYFKVAGNTPVGTLSTMKLLNDRVEIMGGEEFLSQAERNVMRQMDDASLPTYAHLSAVRQQVSDALSKKQGPFKEIATGELKQLYGAFADDQQQAANFYGIGDLYRTENDLVSQRKGLEKDLVDLLGKDLSDAITKKAGNHNGPYKLIIEPV